MDAGGYLLRYSAATMGLTPLDPDLLTLSDMTVKLVR